MTTIHKNRHPKAGEELVILETGTKKRLDDWFDRINPAKSWEHANDIPSLIYRTRVTLTKLPRDNEVVCCEGSLYHVSEVVPLDSNINFTLKGRKQ